MATQTPSPHTSRTARLRAGIPLIAAAAMLAMIFAPTLRWLADTWRVHPYYGHGPLVVAAAVFLAWRARDAWRSNTPSALGLIPLGAGLALHVIALPMSARLVSAAGLLLALAGLALLGGGLPRMRALSLPLLLLALAVPLPLVERTAPFLAARVASVAAWSAGALGAVVQQKGAQLIVGDGVLAVGAPCSGLRSLVALLTLAVFLAGVLDGPPMRRSLIVLAALPLALVANGARLTALLWVAHAQGTDAGLALFHGPVAPLLYMAAAVGLVAISRGLGFDVRPSA